MRLFSTLPRASLRLSTEPPRVGCWCSLEAQVDWAKRGFDAAVRSVELQLVSQQHAVALCVDLWRAVLEAELLWA